MTQAAWPEKTAIRRRNGIAVILLIAFCLAVIGSLSGDVNRRLDALARANSDSVQWSLAQLEVEAQLMRETLATAGVALAEVRKRFDIFYSRIAIFDGSALYAGIRERPDFNADLQEVRTFIDGALPLIDGPDDALRAALPDLAARAAILRDHVRAMSLAGIDHFSIESDRQRSEMALTLRRVAAMTAILIVALIVLAVVLLRLNQRSRAQSIENRLTTARLETIVASSVDAIVVVDRRGTVLEFNPAAETIFGFTRAEAFGRRVTDLIFPPDAIDTTITQIETQLISDEAQLAGRQRIEVEAMRKDRSSFPVELSVARAENASGEIFVAFLRDISARRQAERDLTEARDRALTGERAKADFLTVMSHEMRTPLNGLLGSVDIMGATPLTAAQREILEVIETSGQVLLHHVNAVLDISSAESGILRPASTPFVVEALVREVIANQTGLATAAGNRIELVVVAGPAGRLTGDPARLRQILLNLLGNAVKFTRNGVITVEIEADPEGPAERLVEFRVIDTGIGIAEADQGRVFEDFVTLDSSYGRETGGTGLGLGITRRLVHALGGEIGMESEPGEGSVFWVRLPFGPGTEADPAADTAAPDRPDAVTGQSVLVIEDNAINRFVLRALLEELNHSVTEAVDGLDGVAAAAAGAHGIILMDISMPRLDGIEATRRIRAGSGPSRGARIIAVTAHATPEEVGRFAASGFDDCLVKPVTRSTLSRALSGRPQTSSPARSEPGGAEPLIDAAKFADLVDRLGPWTADNLLRRFVAEGDDVLPRLTGCPPAPDFDLLAHRLAGSAATFGAVGLAALLAALTERNDAEAALADLQSDLTSVWLATRATLYRMRPALSGTAG